MVFGGPRYIPHLFMSGWNPGKSFVGHADELERSFLQLTKLTVNKENCSMFRHRGMGIMHIIWYMLPFLGTNHVWIISGPFFGFWICFAWQNIFKKQKRACWGSDSIRCVSPTLGYVFLLTLPGNSRCRSPHSWGCVQTCDAAHGTVLRRC